MLAPDSSARPVGIAALVARIETAAVESERRLIRAHGLGASEAFRGALEELLRMEDDAGADAIAAMWSSHYPTQFREWMRTALLPDAPFGKAKA